MRLYHKYYRQKNPGRRRAPLRGLKKETYDLLTIDNSGARKNPSPIFATRVHWWNFLGELNRAVDEGDTDFIPLRDVVQAKLEGFLAGPALEGSFESTLRDLTAAQVRVLRKMIDASGGAVSRPARRDMDEVVARDPKVQRLQARHDRALRAQEATETAAGRRKLSGTQYILGPERMAAMKAQNIAADLELGKALTYYPANKSLWQEAAKIVNRDDPDLKARDRLRWKNLRLKVYESLGGREATPGEIKSARSTRYKELGVPFMVGDDTQFLGVVESAQRGGFTWSLLDPSGRIYLSGTSATTAAASRGIGVAYRLLENLSVLGEHAGWDTISDADRRWLDSTRPTLSSTVANILLNNIEQRQNLSPDAARWIVRASDLPSEMKRLKAKEERTDTSMAKTCKNMTLGEEREFRGEGGGYTIMVKKGAGNKYIYYVVTKDGNESQKRRTDDCDSIISRGHAIGGAMTGARDVAAAMVNPAKLKRLQNSADKYFRKQNPPRLPRKSAEEGDIRELSGMISIPYNPEDAYRYGYYAGIVRGIDTCGVQNFLKRRRIRDEFQNRLLTAAATTTARITGTKSGYGPRNVARGIVDDDGEESADDETIGDVVRGRVRGSVKGVQDKVKDVIRKRPRGKSQSRSADETIPDSVIEDIDSEMADIIAGLSDSRAHHAERENPRKRRK